MSCVQATVSPMMQTVIRWRRPSDCELERQAGNPCTNLLGNALCYIISGTLLLVVGVIITSLTFQNLDGQNGENKERYAGPVLIAAGVLVMARGALSRLWPRQRTMSARRRSLLRRYIREIYSRPIFALENSSSFSLCDLEVSDFYHTTSRTRLYSDEPPSYDVVTRDDYIFHNPAFVHAYTNPATQLDDSGSEDGPIQIVIGRDHQVTPPPPPPVDPDPPPSYDEYIKSAEMKTTRL